MATNEKQQKQNVKETFEELFEFESEEERQKHEARMLQYRFLDKVIHRMEEWDLDRETVASDLGISVNGFVNAMRGEIYLDWMTFFKMKEYFQIAVSFSIDP